LRRRETNLAEIKEENGCLRGRKGKHVERDSGLEGIRRILQGKNPWKTARPRAREAILFSCEKASPQRGGGRGKKEGQE